VGQLATRSRLANALAEGVRCVGLPTLIVYLRRHGDKPVANVRRSLCRAKQRAALGRYAPHIVPATALRSGRRDLRPQPGRGPLLQHCPRVDGLHRSVIRVVHHVGKPLDLLFGGRNRILHDEPPDTLGARRGGEGSIEAIVIPVCG